VAPSSAGSETSGGSGSLLAGATALGEVSRDRYPDLRCGSIGYDDWLPHDVLHFVAEAEYGLDGGVFGDLAAGARARAAGPKRPVVSSVAGCPLAPAALA
jgi:hypothetical protein